MQKNLLSDTDYTKGHDNRFGITAAFGKISKLECSKDHANVRVIMADRVDHQDNPLISKPIPVLQGASTAKKSFAMPRLNDVVCLIKLPNGTSNYAVLGSFYTKSNPPPVTDPLLDYTEWEGGHTEKRDANKDADVFLTQDFKGGVKTTVKKDIEVQTTDGGKMSMTSDGDMLVKSANGNVNVESPTGAINIRQKTINLEADTINLTGHVVITGAMDQQGVHRDNNGLHTSGTKNLEERIAALEARVKALEGRLNGS